MMLIRIECVPLRLSAAKLLLFYDADKSLREENVISFRLFAINMCDFLRLFEEFVVFLQR